nr:FERM and PDZ domain-containing protein 4 [Leptinotarsa decemlineata]
MRKTTMRFHLNLKKYLGQAQNSENDVFHCSLRRIEIDLDAEYEGIIEKLLPGDQILSVNGEDVETAPREHVISLVRACTKTVDLVVCQPAEQHGARKSTLLSASKRARLKNKPSRVRFAESVCVNGAPLFPIASRPGAHKLRCLFRVAFVPASAAALAQKDLNALDYLYTQCCNDVIQERFAPELQYDTALRLAALHIYQHALANNMQASKLTVKTVEREFGLERFIPASLLENIKRKEIRKLVGHFLKLHASMAGLGKQLTVLQAKLHYLDIVGQLPSYGAKCFSAGPRGDTMERVILVSPKFGISQITGTRSSVFQPIPIANIEDMRRIEVRSDDEITRTVLVFLNTEKVVTISLEERDACELVLVLRGYFKLATGEDLPVDQEEEPPMEDLAPPYLSQHKVVPEKWSYTNQTALKLACFAVPPVYKSVSKKTNGLYNTMGRQSKQPLMIAYSLDSNMNSSMVDKNRQFLSLDQKSTESGSIDIFDNGLVEARNEEVLRRVREMHQLVEYSEQYLSEQENLERLNSLAEWQETSVDVESDSDEPGKLKHSDSLLLLNKSASNGLERRHSFTSAAIELLRQETVCSESDNDSLYTPNNSPKHTQLPNSLNNKLNRISFGLRSPDNRPDKEHDFQGYLQYLRDVKKNEENVSADSCSVNDMYIFDPDIIDLTLIPPPSTPDELDCALPSPINVPPRSFADSMDKLNKLGILDENQDFEEFLASVTVQPPTQKLTPAVELTPEEIMAYIIPPPPAQGSQENLTITLTERNSESEGDRRMNEVSSVKSKVIEYETFDRRGPFSCCAKNKTDKSLRLDETIQPLPRRSSDEKPPDRPPKLAAQERQRSHSLTSPLPKVPSEFPPPPKLPPRGDATHQAPPHLFLPPKKPPLPPVPSLEVLRQKKNVQQLKTAIELRTASIGSPVFQRSRKVSNDLETNGLDNVDNKLCPKHTTAVSTPTSPHMGRGSHLRLVPVPLDSPGSPKYSHHPQETHSPRSPTHRNPIEPSPIVDDRLKPPLHPKSTQQGGSQTRNGCTSNREDLLQKTDLAMANLLVRLDQVAAQCSAAQLHGGGRFISEEKFQVAKEELTSQSLQLVTSSKMLVIAMSDPSLPDLPENLAICLTILRRLTELCQDLADHTTAPLQTRNLVLKVNDVTAAFRHLLTSDVDRSSRRAIEEHLAAQAESLANVLATLLRSLRVFSP